MAKRDIVVIGASAGGIVALKTIVGKLRADLPAAVFVVQHIGAGINGHSYLPAILSSAGPLPAVHPATDESISHGKIYVAVPDYHLLVSPGEVHVKTGPKVNLARPAINPLFRSAAAAYGPRVTGVILSGMLDDGVAGLGEIRRRGGVCIVQDPATAEYPEMPSNALQCVDADYVSPVEEIAQLITTLAVTEREVMPYEEEKQRELTHLTCPECRGPIWRERQGRIVEFCCRVGHRYSPLSMQKEHEQTVERTAWSLLVALEEAKEIAEAVKTTPEDSERAARSSAQAAALRKLLQEESEFTTE